MKPTQTDPKQTQQQQRVTKIILIHLIQSTQSSELIY